MMFAATSEQAAAALGALYTVASGGGADPLSAADRSGIAGAATTLFGQTGPVDVDTLTATEPTAVSGAIDDADLRLLLVRAAAVMALVDAVIEDAKLQAVLDLAAALEVEADFVTAIGALLRDDIRWAAKDEIRHNVATIPGLPWDEEDPYRPFVPYVDARQPDLTARYEALAKKPTGTLGRAFFDHYRGNGFDFPGEEWAVAEVWGTPHDCLHLLGGYSTSAQGELLVAAFTAGMLRNTDADPMESHIIPTILIYHLGIDINKGMNKGDRARIAADPSWRDNYDGNVHLGLDPAKLWVAWDRGQQMTEDLYSGRWVIWDHVDDTLDDLRARYGIPPLDPAFAAVDDDAVDPEAFMRPGRVLPELGHQRISERPAS